MRFQNLFTVSQWGEWKRWDVNPKIWPESMLLTSLLYDMQCVLNERCMVIPVRTTPTRKGSRERIPGERTAPPALELAQLPGAGLPREGGGMAGLRPSQCRAVFLCSFSKQSVSAANSGFVRLLETAVVKPRTASMSKIAAPADCVAAISF